MKKVLFVIMAMAMFANANAFKFDGIDLNATQQQVAREISSKGYVYDQATNSLKGQCGDITIYLNMDNENVSDKSKIGRLIVNIPMNNANVLENATTIFNVIYHRIASVSGNPTYSVDSDGTIMEVYKTNDWIQLVYITPNYKAKK